ncbi:broad substrate specificity ATP-binding cassette transporter ABCG2-like [Rhopilema esculentum]|uniref:broad substrate specificity ATP-binding cassette transporter ABCG2-like n=1 Tax=Rhopilema esculentum TaxID=499914 RepID=UPI0031DA0B5B
MSHYNKLQNNHDEELGNEVNQNANDWLKSRGSSESRPPSRPSIGTEIAFHNICYTVPAKENRKRVLKPILNNVSGLMKPGLHAILGPTGSGKTTLLDVLAGRKDKKYLTGYVLVNGRRQPKNFRLLSGYVVQDDIIMGTLTVRENLMFSASLRLPPEFSKEDRRARVEMVINDLGLSKVADSKVGNEMIRGISGGERKRTAIGMELIISPDVLFLDEPTTGLDAATASSVMELLAKQTRKGRNVIFSIHQPRYSIFKLFGSLTLLSQGEMAYHGPCSDVLPYFEKMGYTCEMHDNPPDFLLDILGLEERSIKALKAIHEYNSIDSKEDREKYIASAKGEPVTAKYRNTEMYASTVSELEGQVDNLLEYEAGNNNDAESDIPYPTSFFTQFAVNSARNVKDTIRNPKTGVSQIAVNILLAVVIGLIYLQLDQGESGLQNRVGVFFFVTMNMIFGNMNAVQIFISERAFFTHECASGYYRISSYFFAKVLCDIIPMRIIPVTIFSAIAYWMIGLQHDVIKFLIFILTLIATSLSSVAICFVVSSSTKMFALASLFTVLPYIFMMIFSGMLINLKTMTKYLSWLRYLSIFKYSLQTLEINELKDMKFNCGNITAPCMSGNDYLSQQGILARDLWDNIAALFSIAGILLALAYIQLRRIKKEK